MHPRLPGGPLAVLLATLIACQAASPAWAAGRAKVAVGKKPRAAKAAPPLCAPAAPKPTTTLINAPETTHPLGGASELRLSLSTSLRAPPAVAGPAPEANAAATPAPSLPPAAVLTPAAAPVAVPTPVPAWQAAGASFGAPALVAPSGPPPRVYTPRPYPAIGPASVNPYLPRPTPADASPKPDVAAPNLAPPTVTGNPFSSLALSIPILPDSGQSILPKVTKVYPTGEKPLVVVSFKCPTEVVGITPPTIKLLHEAVNLGMAGINKTDLLSFDLQQVCQ